MDLISIARKYRNIRIALIVIMAIAILVIMIISRSFILNLLKIHQTEIAIAKQNSQSQNNNQDGENDNQNDVSNNSQSQGNDNQNDDSNSNQSEANGNNTEAIEFPENWAEQIKNIYKQEEKQVFLTFDDGPSKKVTIPILDLLKQENIKATFFVLGSRVELYPELVKREYEEGHYIANHGYTHIYSQIYSSVQSIIDEYNQTEVAIKMAIGNQEYTSRLFRFPGGSSGGKYNDLKSEAKQQLMEQNIGFIDWNALIGDAEGGTKTVEELLARLDETMPNKNTIVILMHDAGDKYTTYEALPQIIAKLREQGYEFKTFYDLIK